MQKSHAVLTPETPSVVAWVERVKDRPDDYLLRVVESDVDEVEASHFYACQLVLKARGRQL